MDARAINPASLLLVRSRLNERVPGLHVLSVSQLLVLLFAATAMPTEPREKIAELEEDEYSATKVYTVLNEVRACLRVCV
jgi:hypothetical protein